MTSSSQTHIQEFQFPFHPFSHLSTSHGSRSNVTAAGCPPFPADFTAEHVSPELEWMKMYHPTGCGREDFWFGQLFWGNYQIANQAGTLFLLRDGVGCQTSKLWTYWKYGRGRMMIDAFYISSLALTHINTFWLFWHTLATCLQLYCTNLRLITMKQVVNQMVKRSKLWVDVTCFSLSHHLAPESLPWQASFMASAGESAIHLKKNGDLVRENIPQKFGLHKYVGFCSHLVLFLKGKKRTNTHVPTCGNRRDTLQLRNPRSWMRI